MTNLPSPTTTADYEQVLAVAKTLCPQPTSLEVLVAMLACPESCAGRALRVLGLTPAMIEAAPPGGRDDDTLAPMLLLAEYRCWSDNRTQFDSCTLLLGMEFLIGCGADVLFHRLGIPWQRVCTEAYWQQKQIARGISEPSSYFDY